MTSGPAAAGAAGVGCEKKDGSAGKLVACGAGLDGCGFGLAHCVAWSRILAAAHFSTHLPRASTAFGAFLSVSACIQHSFLAFSSVRYSGGGPESGMVGARVARPAGGA